MPEPQKRLEPEFRKLLDEIEELKRAHMRDGSWWTHPPTDAYVRIKTKALNLVRSACGTQSDHYAQLKEFCSKDTNDNSGKALALAGILEAAYEDYKSGTVVSDQSKIVAGVFEDLLEIAKNLLEDPKGAAPSSSIVGSVLEDSLRKICENAGVPYKPSKTDLSSLSQILGDKEVITRREMLHIKGYEKLRDSADHGRFNEVNKDDTSDFLGWTERFIEKYLGSSDD